MRLKLSAEQYRSAVDILGNTAVAWFTIGVIAPLFTHPVDQIQLIASVAIGLLASLAFATSAIIIAGRKKK